MRFLFLLLTFFFSTYHLMAQQSNWAHNDLVVQTRLFQNPSNLKTILDLSLGTEWNYTMSDRFSINLGTAINFGKFENSDMHDSNLFFVSYFKGTRVDYFRHDIVTQLSLEIPLSFQYDVFRNSANKFSLLAGASPQWLLYSKSKGPGLDGEREVVTSIARSNLSFRRNSGNLDGQNHYVFNDLYLTFGASMEHQIDDKKAIMIGVGAHYSTIGDTPGIYLKTGYRF